MKIKGNIVTRKVKILQYKEFEFKIEQPHSSSMGKIYSFIGKKDNAQSIKSDMFIYLFKTTYDGQYEWRKLSPNSSGEYQIVVEERDLNISGRDVYREIKNYFCLSKIELSEARIESILEQLKIGGTCWRLQAIPLARNSSLRYTLREKADSDIDSTVTTVYLSDYLEYAKTTLRKNYKDSYDKYQAWLKDEDDDIKDNYKNGNRANIKLLSEAAFHLAYVVGPQQKRVSAFEMNVGFAMATTLPSAILGPLMLAPGLLPGIYSKWKEFAANYNFHRQKLVSLEKVKGESALAEMPDDPPAGGWKFLDYWRKNFITEETRLIKEYNEKALELVKWIENRTFIEVQLDYEFGSDDDRNYMENSFGDIITRLSLTTYGREYLTNLYENTKRQLDSMLRRIKGANQPQFERYKTIINKNLSDVTESDRGDMVKLAYNNLGKSGLEWWCVRLLEVRLVNQGFGLMLNELAFLMAQESEPVYKLLNIPEEYILRHGGSQLPLTKSTKGFKSWKEAMTSTVMESVKEDTKRLKRITKAKKRQKTRIDIKNHEKRIKTIYIDLDKNYSVVFEKIKVKDELVLVPKLQESSKVNKQNWDGVFIDSKAYECFGTALDVLNIASTIYELITEWDTFDSIFQIAGVAIDLITTFWELSERAQRNWGIASVGIEAILNGKKSYVNIMEEDYDAAFCYIAGLASNAAVIVLMLKGALTGPVGVAVSMVILMSNFIISTFSKYFDDDDYETWLRFCSFGKDYPCQIDIDKPEWATVDFKQWQGNLKAQLESYKELVDDFKLTITPHVNSSDSRYAPVCALNIQIKPKTIFSFSEIRVTFKIDGNVIVADHIFTPENAEYKKTNDGSGSDIFAVLIDGDSPDMNRLGLKALSLRYYGKKWMEKAEHNEVSGFLNAIDQNVKDKPQYQGLFEVKVVLDLYANGEILIEREAKTDFHFEKFFIPSVIEEGKFNEELGYKLEHYEFNDLKSKYKRRECKSCNRTTVCQVHKSKKGIFSDGNISCMRLLDADDDVQYDIMSLKEKNIIRTYLTKASFYVNNRASDFDLEIIY